MSEQEIWKDIPGYEGLYQASSFGRIRTCEGKITSSKLFAVRHWKQRILKPKGQTYKTGYRVSLWKDGRHKDWLVARLVAITFLGDSNLTVNHINGNRFDNRVSNLEWCSLKENIQKGFEIGLYPQKNIYLTNKKTGEITVFLSMDKASKYMGKHHGYISDKVKHGLYENDIFSWKVIKKEDGIYE